MERGRFLKFAATPENPKWEYLIRRAEPIGKKVDIRSDFARDYTRIIHSSGYRRLKHKTQVFFSPQSDHICTRIEHVNHVDSISGTIANFLGLNTELTRAISAGHDLGHSPFGHSGERVLSAIAVREGLGKFWHEQNGIRYVDEIELLENHEKKRKNLNLTYAVRDGIISHCGEVDQNFLFPREEPIDLYEYDTPNKYNPYTYEACIVKIADKISYVGRDIEDALTLGILDEKACRELAYIISEGKSDILNNTIIINTLINDICENSSPENGIALSEKSFDLLKAIRKFNTDNIYKSPRLKPSDNYFKLVIEQIFDTLKSAYKGNETFKELEKMGTYYKNTAVRFSGWLKCYADIQDRADNLANKTIYNLENKSDYYMAIIDYIAGMTDSYAMETYNEIISF